MAASNPRGSGRLFHYVALCILSVVVFMRPLFSGTSAGLFPNMIVVMLIYAAFALWMFEMIVKKNMVLYRSGLGVALALFVIGILLALLESSYPRAGYEHFINFTSYVLLFLVLFDLCAKRELSRYFLILLLASCLVTTLYGLYQYFVVFPEWDNLIQLEPEKILMSIGVSEQVLPEIASRIESKEVFSTFFLSNAFAGFLVVFFPIQLGFFVESVRSKKGSPAALVAVLSAVSIVLILVSMGLTHSIGGTVSFLFGLVVFVVLLCKEWMKRHWLKIIIPLVIIAAILGVVRKQIPFGHLRIMVEDSLRVRMGFWRGATNLVADYPWLGVGPGNFGDYYLQVKAARDHEVQNAHNNFLQLWAECGPLATFAFAMILCFALTRSYSAIRSYEKEKKKPPESAARTGAAYRISSALIAGILGFALLIFIIGSLDVPPGTHFALVAFWMTFVVAFCHYDGERAKDAPGRPYVFYGAFAGMCAFLLHGFVDFDLYIPGTAQSLFVVMAAAIGLKGKENFAKAVERPLRLVTQIALVVVVAGFFFVFLYGVVQPLGEAGRFYDYARQLYFEGKDIDKAKVLAEKAVELDPENAEYHFFLSQIRNFFWKADRGVEGNNFLTAERELLEAIRLDPNRFVYTLHLARLYMEAYWASAKPEYLEGSANQGGAIGMYERTIRLYPTNPKLWKEYGDVLAQVEREREMVRAYRRAKELMREVDQRHVRLSHSDAFLIEMKIMEYEDKVSEARKK